MVVKVQISPASNSNSRKRVLVYNKDKSIHWENDATEDILLLMGQRKKAYFTARVNEKKEIALGEAAPEQDW